MIGKIGIKTRGIVLRTIDYGESDRIINILTEDSGKLAGIAKGARKSRKRFANVLEPFSLLSLSLSVKKNGSMAFIEEAAIVDHFAGIRSDLEKTLTAAYYMDLIDQFVPEGKHHPEIFDLATDYLTFMEREKFAANMVRFFELRFLRLAGYEPVLDRCASCNQPLQSSLAYSFSPSRGGIRCRHCIDHHETGDGIPVSVGTIRTLLLGRESDTAFLSRIFMSDQCAQECQRLLSRFIRYILGKDLKSLNVLNDVRRMGV
ncbi:MAG: DNA repair protein RecO [Syntrophaceae bacterium]|nr:DNA repair protein RecO [Syntrophaceae bacterium]